MSKRISAVDLFCGAGGLTCGLEAAGISVEAGIDFEEDCRYAYETNNEATFYSRDLREVAQENADFVENLFDDSADIELLAGCPPCQPFSPLTNGEASSKHESYGLLDAFGDIIDYVRPDFVVMENVHNVYKAEIYQRFEDRMDEMDYCLNPHSDRDVYCPKYDVPQTRNRWVTLAARGGIPDFGRAVHRYENDFPTVKETIGHLPKLEAGETHPDDPLHTARELSEKNLKRIRNSEPGGTWRDWPDELILDCHREESGRSYDSVYGRMVPDEPAPTITTQFYNLGSGRFGHYDTDQDRALSLREGALLQTFPEDYHFFQQIEELGIRETGKLIGNAVPPHLGQAIGKRVFEFYEKIDRQTRLVDF